MNKLRIICDFYFCRGALVLHVCESVCGFHGAQRGCGHVDVYHDVLSLVFLFRGCANLLFFWEISIL